MLTAVLAVAAPWAERLRAQVEGASVSGRWGPESPSFDIRVEDHCPRAEAPSGPLPLDILVTGAGGELCGELLVWVEEGALAALEYAWYTDEPPRELPDPERITVSLRRGP